MSTFNFLQLENVPIFRQLQIEEALLRADTRNWCLINKGSSPAIVMGISGKESELIEPRTFESSPIPIIRRFSGGGTVVVDEHTVFITWIANTADVQVPCCPKEVLNWTAKIYTPGFQGTGFQLAENDYALNDRKCGGNAQYMCKGRWLHHTSFLWDYQEEHMQYLKMPAKRPAYRADRAHTDFLCRLNEHYSDYDTFSANLLQHLSKHFSRDAISLEEVLPILDRPHRKATTLVDWNPAL